MQLIDEIIEDELYSYIGGICKNLEWLVGAIFKEHPIG